MKKLLSMILAFTMIFAIAVPALAENIPDNPEGTTVERVSADQVMKQNDGKVNENRGTITTNNGTVDENLYSSGQSWPGMIVENHGTVTQNGNSSFYGYIITNADDGVVKSNEGYITTNEGTIESNNKFAQVNFNEGTMTTNSGILLYNDGTLTENKGTVADNCEDGVIGKNNKNVDENNGTIEENNGAVDCNNGLIKVSDGSVDKNGEDGVVEENNGTMESNDGVVKENNGFVTANYGTIEENSSCVQENQDSGCVTNVGEGTVETNYGTMTDTDGLTWYGIKFYDGRNEETDEMTNFGLVQAQKNITTTFETLLGNMYGQYAKKGYRTLFNGQKGSSTVYFEGPDYIFVTYDKIKAKKKAQAEIAKLIYTLGQEDDLDTTVKEDPTKITIEKSGMEKIELESWDYEMVNGKLMLYNERLDELAKGEYNLTIVTGSHTYSFVLIVREK